MYIEPNTTIKVIRNCPLDIGNDDTIYFTSKAQQTNFFLNVLEGYTFNRQSYQRVNKGSLRVERNAESLYNCNYLAFQNASFGTKWFYAFITKIEYVNNVTSEITYVLDVMQTWHFDYVLMDCFVEREHSVTDEIGDNLVPEKLETGEYISSTLVNPEIISSYDICFWCTFLNESGFPDSGGTLFNQGYGSYYSGLNPIRFPLTAEGIADAQAFLASIPPLKINGIVSVGLVPNISNTALDRTITISKRTSLMRADGTAVKNKKCLTYPYNALYVSNNQGKSAIFRYEFFNSEDCEFSAFADVSPSPTILLFPNNYKGLLKNFDEKIELTGFPQIAYNIDSYKAWLAQSVSSVAINGMTAGVYGEGYQLANMQTMAAVASGATSIGVLAGMEGAMLGGMVIPLVALASKAIQGTVHMFMPAQARGQQGSNVLIARGKMNFEIIQKHITPEFATIIDDYFTMYGYATNKVKRPNRNARPEWNYVKTIGCKIDGVLETGGVPAEDAKLIEDIYNKGVRFWNNPAHIGNYSYDNSPTI